MSSKNKSSANENIIKVNGEYKFFNNQLKLFN